MFSIATDINISMRNSKTVLSADSHIYLAEQMTKRAAWAGPLHAIAYTVVFTHVPGLTDQTWPYLILFAMLASSALRFVIHHFAGQLVAHPVTRKLWRATFAFSSLLLAGGWAAYACILINHHGLDEHSVTAIVAACGVIAAAVPAFSYDLPLLIAFVVLTMLPIAGAVAATETTSGLFPSLLIYTLFMTALAVAMNRFEYSGQKQIETIRQQKKRLEALHVTMTTMIESLDEAFLLIDENGFFHHTQSPRAHELFACNPSDKPLHEVLKVTEDERPMLNDWLKVCFERHMDFESLASLGPARYHDPERGVQLALRYRPLYAKDGRLSSIVLLARDVSREVEAERVAKTNVARAEMVIQAMQNPKAFRELLAASEATFNGMQDGRILAGTELNHELHTLKGGAMMFRAEGLTEQIFKAERQLKTQPSRADVRTLGKELTNFLAAWKFSEGEFLHLVAQIQSREDQGTQTLHSQLRGFNAAVNATARELGKSVRLEIIPCPPEEDPIIESQPAVLNTFVHLFNNAVDHGVESPDVREERGKPRFGRITVRTELFQRRTRKFVRVLVSDDGGGINRTELRSSLQRKGIREIPADPDELTQMIFQDGVTSCAEATKISGAGVGLSAVKAAAEDCGGSVHVVKSDTRGTDIEVLIPLSALSLNRKKNAA